MIHISPSHRPHTPGALVAHLWDTETGVPVGSVVCQRPQQWGPDSEYVAFPGDGSPHRGGFALATDAAAWLTNPAAYDARAAAAAPSVVVPLPLIPTALALDLRTSAAA